MFYKSKVALFVLLWVSYSITSKYERQVNHQLIYPHTYVFMYSCSNFKHMYLRYCAYKYLSLSSSPSDISSLDIIEILVLVSWISHPRIFQNNVSFNNLTVIIVVKEIVISVYGKFQKTLKVEMEKILSFHGFVIRIRHCIGIILFHTQVRFPGSTGGSIQYSSSRSPFLN